MIKKGLLFGLIAVVSAALALSACSTGTDPTSAPAVVEDGIPDGRPANTEAELQRLLGDADDSKPIIFSVDSTTTLNSVIRIPEGKIVYIKPANHSTGGTLIPATNGGLIIAGTVIVTENAELKASDNRDVHVVNGGVLEVYDAGTLSVDSRVNVDNYPDGAQTNSVLTNVRYAGGSTLKIAAEALKITEIQELLGVIPAAASKAAVAPSGTSKLVLGLPQNFMPSELVGITGISDGRYLEVIADKAETETSLDIPAGIAITATKSLPVTALTVSGGLDVVPANGLASLTTLTVTVGGDFTALGNTLPALTTLTVSGILNAPEAKGATAGITITVAATGEVTVGSVKITPASKVSAGGHFDGDTGTDAIDADKGAILNGQEKTTEGTIVILGAIPASLPTGTAQLKPGSYIITTALTLAESATLLIPEKTTVTIAAAGSLTVNGALDIALGNTVTVAAGGSLTKGTAGIINNAGTIVFEADTAANLNGTAPATPGAIGKVKALGGDSSKAFVQLTQAFYTAATSGPLVIDASDADKGADNSIPYTIKGLGTGDTAPSLTVGILLANDNVTLMDVKINITTTANAQDFVWINTSKYYAAIYIGRAYTASSTTTLMAGADLPSKNVTVRNNKVAYTASTANFTAGIWVAGGEAADAFTTARDITITGNEVKVTGNASLATQALGIGVWHPSIIITNNRFESRYGTKPTLSATPSPYIDAPVSAIYVRRTFDHGDNGDPVISGNTLLADAYNFYMNTEAVVPSGSIVAPLRTRGFATANTTWALPSSSDQTSIYKKLFNALKSNLGVTDVGFGFVSIVTGTGFNDNGWEYEQYEIARGIVTAISVWGDHIVDGVYVAETTGTGNKFNSTSNTDKFDYGRILVSNPTDITNTATNKFCFGVGSTGGYQYDTDYSPATN
jgi:hypothetical protein